MKEETRKITAILPAGLLASAQAATGKGITETICEGLEQLRRQKVYQAVKRMRGKVKFDMTWQELRGKGQDRDLTAFVKGKPKRNG